MIHLSDVMMILVLKDLVVPMLIVNLKELVQYVDAGNKMVYLFKGNTVKRQYCKKAVFLIMISFHLQRWL